MPDFELSHASGTVSHKRALPNNNKRCKDKQIFISFKVFLQNKKNV